MPSHCLHDCACACTETTYKIRDIEISKTEYDKIKKVLGEVESEKKENKRGELEKSLGKIQSKIDDLTAKSGDLKKQYRRLLREYKQYK